MKHLLSLFLLLAVPVIVFAQEDEKYLAGAVPEVNGKVVFSKELQVPSQSKSQLFNTLLNWAEGRFNNENNRVVYKNAENGEIAVVGEEYLVFSQSVLSLDRSLMSYRLIIRCEEHSCQLSLQSIRYEYNVSYQKEPERYTAEEWITDKEALNKGKLMRLNGKFRTGTIDYVDKLFNDVELLFWERPSSQPAVLPKAVAAPLPPEVEAAPMTSEGYNSVSPDKIPGNIIQRLTAGWMLVSAGENASSQLEARWGGLGYLMDKPVAFCFVDPAQYVHQLMEKNDTFTLSFYAEGSDKAGLIIECRKLISQSIGEQMNKMYIGEIINVWIKQ